MGGSGGGSGGPYYDVSPAELARRLDQSSAEIADGFLPHLQDLLGNKLAAFDSRNHELMNRRRSDIKAALSDVLDTTWDLPYGGSVAKHTYVDGLSDVDSLLIMKDGNAGQARPSEIRGEVAEQLKPQLVNVDVSIGQLAVTVRYSDGMEIQLVPAVREGGGYRVPSWNADRWSKINPQNFRNALTRRNDQCDGKLIPVIKLAKAIVSTWPEIVRLSGYHVESLAIDAFRGYSGDKNYAKMLPLFFEKAASSVLSPIRDMTGQSINVDGYLGKSHSTDRRKASHWCSQTAKRMRQATLRGSRSQWEDLFE